MNSSGGTSDLYEVTVERLLDVEPEQSQIEALREYEDPDGTLIDPQFAVDAASVKMVTYVLSRSKSGALVSGWDGFMEALKVALLDRELKVKKFDITVTLRP